ncbi:hypothetical protein [Kordiimonas laminariae]|uniref:hypothetical protein n=1 Tax=Kordiimonas laminariae TaxID=2917717 RepID=UPI001FF32EA5|nr:hypothetical protein [Kordiimonas laminariae]MCK0068976.1 hypothetical protein [Kordiimonas laminariae]
MKMKTIGTILSVTILSATAMASDAGFAQDNKADTNNYAAKELKAQDWSSAETALLGKSFAKEDDVFAKLNLAFVYSTTGRQTEAVAMYKEILNGKENPYALLRSGKTNRVKTIAKRALRRLGEQG